MEAAFRPSWSHNCEPVCTDPVNLDDHDICGPTMYLHISVETCMKQCGHLKTKLPPQAQKGSKGLNLLLALHPSVDL